MSLRRQTLKTLKAATSFNTSTRCNNDEANLKNAFRVYLNLADAELASSGPHVPLHVPLTQVQKCHYYMPTMTHELVHCLLTGTFSSSKRRLGESTDRQALNATTAPQHQQQHFTNFEEFKADKVSSKSSL